MTVTKDNEDGARSSEHGDSLFGDGSEEEEGELPPPFLDKSGMDDGKIILVSPMHAKQLSLPPAKIEWMLYEATSDI